MSLPSSVKDSLRRVTWLYEWVRKRRARDTEAEYVSLRDQYYAQTRGLFSEPGYLVKSRKLLRKHWPGPRIVKSSPEEVRLLVVFATVAGAACWYRAVEGSFDTVWIDHADYNSRMEQGDTAVRDRFQRELLEAFHQVHRERPIDLVWLHVNHLHVAPRTLNEMRQAGVPVAVHSLDDKHIYLENPRRGFPNGQKPLIGAVDVHLTNSLECVRWYMAEGAAAYYMPQGVEPEVFKPLPMGKDLDVSFIGAAYGMRRQFVKRLRQAGVQVSCFGRGWGTRRVSAEEQIEIYSRSWINLGIGGVGNSDRITCIKGRDMSVPGSGNVLLTLYDAELARMWCVGEEILYYYNDIDCIDQIHYYLERPEELLAIGKAARERALREHTWTHRMTGLLRWMGILAQEA